MLQTIHICIWMVILEGLGINTLPHYTFSESVWYTCDTSSSNLVWAGWNVDNLNVKPGAKSAHCHESALACLGVLGHTTFVLFHLSQADYKVHLSDIQCLIYC